MRISDWSSDVCSSDLISPRQNPEFTTMELYQAYADYEDMMDIAERTIAQAAIIATGSTRVTFGDHEIDFTPPFRRATMLGLIEEHGKVKLEGLDDAAARDAAKQAGVDRSEEHTSELQSLMSRSYDVFCMKKKTIT